MSNYFLFLTNIINNCIYYFFIIRFFIEEIHEYLNLFKYCEIIGYFIIFIFALIYNEIIICNFCGLNKNTKKFICKRAKEENINPIEIKDNNDEIEIEDNYIINII